MALEYELNDAWPSPSARSEFWTRPRVPTHLDFLSAPDPRVVLSDDPYLIEQYRRDVAAFRERRIAWLTEKVDG